MNWPKLFENFPNKWKNFIVIDSSTRFLTISNFLEKQSSVIHPNKNEIFSAFELDPLNVKCVILGQDPYHGPNQAHGLSFSVKENITPPPSLKNIFKELKNDLDFEIPKSGYLEKWKRQGVFLLNTVLTVEKGKPKSHADKGWEIFTKSIIKSLSDKRENLVFILWGNNAISYSSIIDSYKHLILKSAHPSPFSAEKGFFGSKSFSKANSYLKQNNIFEIDWRL